MPRSPSSYDAARGIGAPTALRGAGAPGPGWRKPVKPVTGLAGKRRSLQDLLGLGIGRADPNMLSMLFGFGDRSGGRARRVGEAELGPAELPGRWEGESVIPERFEEPSPSPEEVIRAQEPRIQEALNKYAAQAAARLGQSGALGGSGYAKTLGEQARRGAKDIAEVTSKYKYQSAENAAQRALDAYRQHGAWEFAGGQGDLARSLQEHGMYGDWMMEGQRLERGRQSQIQDLLFRLMSGG